MEPITSKDMADEVKREIAMRHVVYVRQVQNGKMSQQEASRRIAVMEEVLKLIYMKQIEEKLWLAALGEVQKLINMASKNLMEIAE